MCGIVAFWDKSGGHPATTGSVVLSMLQALACRGPDSAGIALVGPEPELEMAGVWHIRITPPDENLLERLTGLGRLVASAQGTAMKPGQHPAFCVPAGTRNHPLRPGTGARCPPGRAGSAWPG